MWHTLKRKCRTGISYIFVYLRIFFKWAALAALTGVICGGIGTLFHYAVEAVTALRQEQNWLIFLLPFLGLAIVFLYRLCRMDNDRGTDGIIESVSSPRQASPLLAPLIFISTVLTHLGGGSAGREGAALQIGGSVGATMGKIFRLNERDLHLITLCGMSAVFSALFGTPVTATVFSMEVISVGVMYYSALVPCVLSAAVAYGVTVYFGISPTAFALSHPAVLSLPLILQVIVLSGLCAALSVLFCAGIGRTKVFFRNKIPNAWLRILAGSLIIILLTFLVGSQDYNGTGMDTIQAAVHGKAVPPEAFLLKLLFTAVTLGCGFKGGEIVPAMFVGAAFGSFAGSLLGMDTGLAAAVGLVSLFCGSVNCPIASVLLSVELFGSSGLLLFSIACAVSFMLSGYYGLYSSQKFIYSKFRAKFVNKTGPGAH